MRGGAAIIHCLHPEGERRDLRVGPDPAKGDSLQASVPRGTWFGAELVYAGSYALVSCTVAPGFEFEDFRIGDRQELLAHFPQHAALIQRLCQRD